MESGKQAASQGEVQVLLLEVLSALINLHSVSLRGQTGLGQLTNAVALLIEGRKEEGLV